MSEWEFPENFSEVLNRLVKKSDAVILVCTPPLPKPAPLENALSTLHVDSKNARATRKEDEAWIKKEIQTSLAGFAHMDIVTQEALEKCLLQLAFEERDLEHTRCTQGCTQLCVQLKEAVGRLTEQVSRSRMMLQIKLNQEIDGRKNEEKNDEAEVNVALRRASREDDKLYKRRYPRDLVVTAILERSPLNRFLANIVADFFGCSRLAGQTFKKRVEKESHKNPEYPAWGRHNTKKYTFNNDGTVLIHESSSSSESFDNPTDHEAVSDSFNGCVEYEESADNLYFVKGQIKHRHHICSRAGRKDSEQTNDIGKIKRFQNRKMKVDDILMWDKG